MLSVEEAQHRVMAEVVALGVEEVTLADALGRVIAEEVVAPRDVPGADNSAMDGYAVLSSDLANASREQEVALRVVGDIPAGHPPPGEVMSGTAMRIMTGAFVPPGADAVVEVEATDAGSEVVRIFRSVRPGANIRRRGEDLRAGSTVMHPGTVLRAGEIGVLATAQRPVVRVGRRPVVSVFSTGDELVDIDAPVGEAKIVNSNLYSLQTLVRESGAIPRPLGIVRDSREETIAAIESALESDFVISSGGVSVGAYDFVKEALEALGAETRFWQVAMKPGKPLVLSRVRDRVYFGLPGNPVSCMVSFLLFVAPAIRKAMGQREGLFPPVVNVRLAGRLTSKGDRRVYNRVRVVAEGGELVAYPARAQGSGVSSSMLQANALAILEVGTTEVQDGAVPVLLFGPVH